MGTARAQARARYAPRGGLTTTWTQPRRVPSACRATPPTPCSRQGQRRVSRALLDSTTMTETRPRTAKSAAPPGAARIRWAAAARRVATPVHQVALTTTASPRPRAGCASLGTPPTPSASLGRQVACHARSESSAPTPRLAACRAARGTSRARLTGWEQAHARHVTYLVRLTMTRIPPQCARRARHTRRCVVTKLQYPPT